MKPEKIVVDELIHDMEHRPSDFICDRYTLKDQKKNIHYWIANGASFARVYVPFEMNFGFIQGWRFHSALKKWKAWNILNRG